MKILAISDVPSKLLWDESVRKRLESDPRVGFPHESGQLVIDDLDDLLPGVQVG